MFKFLNVKKAKALIVATILSALLIGFVCISLIHAAPSHMGMGEMHNHSSQTASLSNCCDAGVSDHMELWKSTLVGIPQSFQDLVQLIVFAVATSFAFAGFLALPHLDANLFSIRFRQYDREHPDVLTYNPLRLAFARGILHPKTF